MALKLIGIVAIGLAVMVIPISVAAGNPAALGVGFGGLLAGALLVGFARVIFLLERITANTERWPGWERGADRPGP